MKKFVIMLALLSITTFCAVAQSALKFMSYGFNIGFIRKGGSDIEWDGWEKCNIPVIFYSNKNLIKVYNTADDQEYRIIDYDSWDQEINKTCILTSAICIDYYGEKCSVIFEIPHDKSYTKMYIVYPDCVFLYKMDKY